MRGEEEEAGKQQSGGAVERAAPLSHFTGAGPRLRQAQCDSSAPTTFPCAPYAPSPRTSRANKMVAHNKMAP